MQKAIGTQESQGNRLNKEAFAELQAVANTTPTLLGKLFGVEGGFKEGGFDFVTKERREAAQARIRELSTAESTIRTAPTMATSTSTSGTNTMAGPNIPSSSQVTVNLVVDSEKLASTFQSIPMKG
jgi:hypothetical protein